MMFETLKLIWIFLNKVEINKQYRQSVTNCRNFDFFESVMQKFQRL